MYNANIIMIITFVYFVIDMLSLKAVWHICKHPEGGGGGV